LRYVPLEKKRRYVPLEKKSFMDLNVKVDILPIGHCTIDFHGGDHFLSARKKCRLRRGSFVKFPRMTASGGGKISHSPSGLITIHAANLVFPFLRHFRPSSRLLEHRFFSLNPSLSSTFLWLQPYSSELRTFISFSLISRATSATSGLSTISIADTGSIAITVTAPESFS